MNRGRNRRKNRYQVSSEFASFGDIAIQLVIFFILASQFAKEPSADLVLAKSDELQTLKTPLVLIVIDDRDRIYVNAEEVPAAKNVETLLTNFFQQREATRDKSEHGSDDEEKKEENPLSDRIVHLKCHRGAMKHVYEPVIEANRKSRCPDRGRRRRRRSVDANSQVIQPE